MSNDEEKEITNRELLEAMNRSFSKIEGRMATKEDLTRMATKEDLTRMATKEDLTRMATKEDLTRMATKEDLAQISVDLQSFKVETRERFDSLEEKLKDMDENITGIVGDYHPHIVALEEKVFGHSTLAEA